MTLLLSAQALLLSELPWQGWLAIAVLAATFMLTALTRLAPDLIFLGALTTLLLSDALDVNSALAGFSNPGMITVGLLYVVVTGLQQTGALAWITHHVLGMPGGLRRAHARLIAPVVVMSAFLNNTPVVAMFIPVVSDWARKMKISPSKLMIPLSYAAIFGGTCTLIGTNTNLIVNGMMIAEGAHAGPEGLEPWMNGFRMFDITLVALPCALMGCVYLIFFSRCLLPDRKPAISETDDPRQYAVEMVIMPESPLAGQTVEQAGLRHLPGLYLVEIDRDGSVMPAVGPHETLRANDRLIFAGVVDSIVDLRKFRGLEPATNQVFKLDAPRQERCLVEAVVSNSCPLVGKTIREGNFRTVYNAAVLAAARNGERIKGKLGDVALRTGDTLLLEAHPSFLDRQRVSRDFYLVSEVANSEPLRHDKAPVALAILIVMVTLAAFGWLSMLKAAMLAAAAMLITRCCSADRARGSAGFPHCAGRFARLGRQFSAFRRGDHDRRIGVFQHAHRLPDEPDGLRPRRLSLHGFFSRRHPAEPALLDRRRPDRAVDISVLRIQAHESHAKPRRRRVIVIKGKASAMNRFLKCGIIAIIGLILLYGILTGLAHWFIENQTLTYIPACKADMRSLATALEAYRIDCGLYPAWGSGKQGVHADFSKDDPIYQLPTFRIWTSPDEHSAFALLSTPLGYINTYPPDHFAPKLGATYSYYTNGDFCILIGAAADQDYDIDPMTALDRTTSKTLISELADRLIEQQYDPTNGTFSDGDLFRILSSYE